MVSSIICFCHSANLPNYHGRYLEEDNHRIDHLSLKLDRAIRENIRPQALAVDHQVPGLDIFWKFKEEGLENLQVNGHLSLVSPGDARMAKEDGAGYSIMRHKIEYKKLIKMREKHSDQLALDGFSTAEFDELIELKQKRLDYMESNPDAIKEMMAVYTQPLSIIKSNRPK